jgi:hypothetical protein
MYNDDDDDDDDEVSLSCIDRKSTMAALKKVVMRKAALLNRNFVLRSFHTERIFWEAL